jgi:cysteine desulfurase
MVRAPEPPADWVYLDWNATTPLHPAVVEAMARAADRAWANPASIHGAGRAARDELEGARELLAAQLGFHPRDVVFTGSGTEANNLALHRAGALVTSRIEHPSVVNVALALEQRGVPVRWLPVGVSGAVEPEAVSEALAALPAHTDGPVVVAVMAANHETGVLQPLTDIAERVHAAGARLHVDAVQLLGRGDLSPLAAADTVSVAAHKLRGPKGIGALLWRPGQAPHPLLRGGAQERGLRPGTQDAVAAAGFRAALERCPESARRYAELAPWRDRLERELEPWTERNGSGARLPHVTNLSVRGWRGDEVVAALDLQGVFVSSGSACSAGTTEPSPVITALHGRERASEAIRISLGEGSQAHDLERALAAFRQILGRA